jgi:cation diffusion facilitator CzcD-associated flavoprotein CzcO
MPEEERYDAIVIGAGQAGVPLAHPTLAEAFNTLFLHWEPDPVEVMLSQAAYGARGMEG